MGLSGCYRKGTHFTESLRYRVGLRAAKVQLGRHMRMDDRLRKTIDHVVQPSCEPTDGLTPMATTTGRAQIAPRSAITVWKRAA